MSRYETLHPAANALTAFRALPDGSGRQYTATSWEPDPWRGCEHLIRSAQHVGFVKTSHPGCGCYAVLDVLDVNGEIVQDFCITTPRAFRWLYRKLDLRVVS